MARKEREIQSLQERVMELERQLAEAQAVIQALTPSHGDPLQLTAVPRPETQEQAEIDLENLIISEAGVRRAIYAVPYPLMIRRDDGQVVMINAAWTKITGYTLEDIPTIDEWTRKAYGREAPQTKSLILNEGFSQDVIKQWGEFEVTTRSGEKRIWDFSTASLGVDEQGRRLVMAMAVDITERKQVEKELRSARDEATWLARFPGENPNPIVRVSNEGIVLYCNPPAASLRGWRCAVDTALSRPLLDLVELAVEQGQAVEQDVSLGDKFYSVTVIPILKQGYLNLYGRDITERKEAEKALAESERRQREITRLLELDQARLAAILRHLPVGVWIMDQQGRLIGNNEQADRIWAGESPLLNSPDDYPKYVSWNAETGKLLEPEEYPVTVALRTGQPVEPVELKIRRFDGTKGTVLASAAPIKDNQGQLMGVVRVHVDISDRKKAEERLRESEAKYRSLVETAFEGVWVVDTTGGTIFVNRRMAEMLKYDSPDTLMKHSAFDFVPPEDLDEVKAKFTAHLRANSPEHYDVRLRCRDGSIVWASAASNNVLDRHGIVIGRMALFMDITERKQAEAHINDLLALNEKILNHSSVGILTYKVSGQCVFANEKIASIMGTSVDALLTQNFHMIATWKKSGLYDLVQQAISTQAPATADIHHISTFGKDVWVTVHCITFQSKGEDHVLLSISDITERKNAEEALRKSEERFAKAFHASPDAIIISRLRDGLIMEVNEVWSTIFGYKPDQVLGRTTLEVGVYVNPEDRKKAIEHLNKNGFLRDFDVPVRSKSGEIREASLSAERIEINGVECLLAILEDITERKLAEQALRESEARYRGLVESQLDLIVRVDLEGRFTFVNDAYCGKFGLRREEILGRESYKPLVHPEDLPHTLEAMQSLYQPPYRAIMEQRAFAVEGVRWIEWQDSAILAETGKIVEIQAIGRDITDRKQAEAALRESEQRLKRAQEIAHLGSWELDLITNRLTWSDEVYRIFGLQPQEFGATYEAFLEAVHPDDRTAVDNAYSSSIREGRDTYEIEHRVVKHSSGEVRIVHEKCEHFRDQSGQIIRSTGMVHDITERKQAEEALQESERRFRSLADSMPQLVWTALTDGTVDYYNQRYQEYKEIKQVEGAAWEWAPVLHSADLQPTVAAWQQSVETGEIYQVEHQVQMADGSYRWHLSRGVPVRDESGSVIRWFGTATDIHDLKQAEEQLKVYAHRLEQSNRELEEFAFMASHDLQEPLRKIEMFGDMLLDRATYLNERERGYVDRMRNASRRMRGMVEGLLQLSRVTTQGKPFVEVNLSEVTAEVLHDLEGQLRRTSGRVNVETLPTIEGDALQLRQLMQNLIGNALKYHQPGTPPEVNVGAKQLSEKVQILVEDKGIGFAQEDAKRIFQPFQRLVGRSLYEGSGMGLAICRRIVERHGGEIAALSEPGHGTTFIVTMPRQHSGTVTNES